MAARRAPVAGVPQPVGLGDRVVRVPRRLSQRVSVKKPAGARAPLRPTISLAFGFVALILLGSVLLLLPLAAQPGRSTDFLTALFTATSAVCVTGLTVVPTAEHWTTFGQVVILLLIQIGGLGFMTGAILIFTLVGRRTSLRERLVFRESLGLLESGGLTRLVRRIVLFTLAVEGIGVALMWWQVSSDPTVENPVWWSLFHAVSAFANAGFDIEPGGQSLRRLLGEPGLLAIFGGLIVLGGLGFLAVFDVLRARSWRRLPLESRLLLVSSLALWIGGFAVLWILAPTFGGSVDGADLGGRATAALFHSVSARTAGFSNVPIGGLPVDTLTALMVLMFVGAASASMGGGVKVNTLAVIGVAALSHIRGRRQPQAFGRTIPTVTVLRALTVAALSAALVILITLSMSLAERGSGTEFPNLLFEAVSAFSLVGYSTGITPDLSLASKLILVIAMFVGRMGALTLIQALVRRERQPLIKYPEEAVKIG